jgi:hypothetical protein
MIYSLYALTKLSVSCLKFIYDMELNFRPAILVLLIITLTSCISNSTINGVAHIDKSPAIESSASSDTYPSDMNPETYQPSDEEITTRFTSCMRNHGFDTPDPELNADGTINWAPIKQSISQDPKFKGKDSQTLDDCLPLLEEATFSQDRPRENEIEIQDNLLQFAQCLRDNGIDVPDPDFSNGTRAAMKPIIQDIEIKSSKIQKSLDSCNSLVFGLNPRMKPK